MSKVDRGQRSNDPSQSVSGVTEPTQSMQPGGMLGGLAAPHGTAALVRRVQRRALQRRGEGDPGLANAEVQALADKGTSGGGGEVPHRARMEQAFGTSFADVSAHTDGSAAHASRGMDAEAYTVGNRVAFATPQPSEALVAHELAHVVQQRAGAGPADGVGHEGDAYEQEAHAAAATVQSGGKTDLAARYSQAGPQAALQRKAVQRYESGEHAMLGCGAAYPFVGGAEVTLPNGAVVYGGELVAFPDFYANLEQIARVPRQESEALAGFCRAEALWFQARRKSRELAAKQAGDPHDEHNAPGSTPQSPTPADGKHSAGVTAGGGDERHLTVFPEIQGTDDVWKEQMSGKTLKDWRDAIYAQFTPVWSFFGMTVTPDKEPPGNYISMIATLGRRRFRDNNDTLYGKSRAADPSGIGGDYLDLATNNVSHFAPNSWENWKKHHEQSCQEHRDAKDEQKKNLALARDMMGCHYLTDRFSAGHTVNKEELMTYATGMMLKAAGRDPDKRGKDKKEGEATHEALKDLLSKALTACFKDDAVAAKWDEGVDLAAGRHLISPGEVSLLKGLPKTSRIHDNTIAAQVRDVIMDMPWRKVDGQIQLDSDSRSYGPASADKGQGDYHPGVGNLAALQVHNALNAIGFTVKNGQGKTWRMQGDAHLTDATQETAHSAVEASQAQVRSGTPQPDEIMNYMPVEGYIDPQWIRDHFQSGEAVYDDGRITELCKLVDGKKIPLGVSEADGLGHMCDMMTEVCHRIMEIIFLAPKDSQGQVQDPSGTGLNISMLKSFLIKNLPDMVSMSYAATSSSDLPQAALEAYAPSVAPVDGKGDPQLLPRAANDFTWEGTRVHFNLNVTGCPPGDYTLGLSVRDRDWGYDFTESGQHTGRGVSDPNSSWVGAAANAKGKVNEDSEVAATRIQVRVPSDPVQPQGAGGRKFLPVSYELPARGTGGKVLDFFTGDDRYVLVYADAGSQMCIGRSGSRTDSDVALSNPHPDQELPQVTGPEGQRTRPGPRVTGIAGGSFQWSGASVLFRLATDALGDGASVTVYVKTFNKDWGFDYDPSGKHVGNSVPGGSDPQIGGVRAISAKVSGGESETVVFPVGEDNPGDTYIVVFRDPGCQDPLARSDTQGNNTGGKLAPKDNPSKATGASGFVWTGARLRFTVTPPAAGQVWLKWFDKDLGFDYDERGQLIPGARDTDDQVGGLMTVPVQPNGVAEAIATGDADNSGDTYAIVYSDPEGTRPLARSNVQP